MKIIKAILSAGILFISSQAYAVNCAEKVTNVIAHSNGQIYFQTDTTCAANWCQLYWSDAKMIDRAYAALLTALTTDKTVVFEWNSLTSCTSQNQVYAVPGYVALLR